jgi:hypothetical protein
MMDVPASTKRNPVSTGGVVGEPTTYLAGLFVTELVPLTPDVVEQMGLTAKLKYYECDTDGDNDVQAGDVLVVRAREYPVRAVNTWPWREFGATSQSKKRLTVEERRQGE